MQSPLFTSRLAAVLFVLGTLIFCSSSHLRAQSNSESPDLDDIVTQATNRNWYVKVTLSDSTQHLGRVRGFRSHRFLVGTEGVDPTLVISMDRRVRSNSGGTTGAFLGGLAGAVLIAAPLSGLASDPDSNGSAAKGRAAFIGATAFSVILGMLIGEALDSGDEGWVRVWSSQ